MPGGTEFSEAEVKPIKEEVEVNPEKQAEIKEVAEQTEKLDDATLKPAEVVEGGDYKAAEALETAFVEAVAAVPAKTVEVAEFEELVGENEGGLDSLAESPELSAGGGGMSSGSVKALGVRVSFDGKSGLDLDDDIPTGEGSETDPEAGAVAEVSAVPEISFEGSGEEGTVIIEKAVEEKPDVSPAPVEQTQEGAAAEVTEAAKEEVQPSLEKAQAEQVPEASVARSAESQTVPEGVGVERDDGEPKMVLVDKDGGSGRLVPDDGVDQLIDLHEDNQIKDQFGGLDERGESVGYQGDPAQGAEGIPEIPGMIPDLGMDGFGKGGGDIPDLGLPGLDEMGEVAGLADSAAPGANPFISADPDPAPADPDPAPADPDPAPADPDPAPADPDPDPMGGTPYPGAGANPGGKRRETVRLVVGRLWAKIAGSSDKGQQGSIGVRGTPTPDSVENVDFDHTLGGLIPGALPEASPEDDLDDESVMQPVGEEDSASRKEPGIAFDRSSQTDPYAQYTGEETSIPSVIPASEADADGNLIDGPDIVMGEEGGFISTDSSKKNAADTEDASNLNAADLGDGQVPKP